jgi:hypothetical protein
MGFLIYPHTSGSQSGWPACSAAEIQQWRSFLSSKKKTNFLYEALFILLFTSYILQFTIYIVLSVWYIPHHLGSLHDMLRNKMWRHTIWPCFPLVILFPVWMMAYTWNFSWSSSGSTVTGLDDTSLARNYQYHATCAVRVAPWERSEVHIQFCHKAWRKEMALNI